MTSSGSKGRRKDPPSIRARDCASDSFCLGSGRVSPPASRPQQIKSGPKAKKPGREARFPRRRKFAKAAGQQKYSRKDFLMTTANEELRSSDSPEERFSRQGSAEVSI